MKNYTANVEGKFFWIIPLLIGFSKNLINKKPENYSIFITPFIEISFNYLGARHGYKMNIVDENTNTVIDNKEEVKKILQSKFNYTDDVLAEKIENLYKKQ